MKKIFIILTALILMSNSLYASKGKIRVASDTKGAYIYVNDKKKAMVGEGFTSILLQEGEYTIKVEKIGANGEWIYTASQKVFVGEDTSTKITLNTKKIATQKRQDRLAKEKMNRDIKTAKAKKNLKSKMSKDIKNGKALYYKGKYYKVITSPYTNKKWLDRNLGASRACTAYNDKKCYGDYFQWGRSADGHEKKNSSTTSTLSSSDYPNHAKFIKAPDYNPWDWRIGQNDNLWQSASGKSNACPKGFRVPKISELLAETTKHGVKNRKDAYNNFLRLPSAGNRYYSDGSLHSQGSNGGLWSSSVSGEDSKNLYFFSDYVNNYNDSRAYGFSVRCTKD